MINIAIVEDEEECVERLKQYLDEYSKEFNEPFDITWFKNGIIFLEANTSAFNLVFMDIEMPHINGMETAKRLREKDANICIIFITNLAQYAIKGYEVEAMDFMVKPVEYRNLRFKLQKAVALCKKRRSEEVVLSTGNGVTRIEIGDIYYIEVSRHKLIYHTARGNIEAWNSLTRVEADLAEHNFVRCNNCYLVNLKHVTGLYTDTVTVGEDELKISRPKKKEFVNAVTLYLGGGR